MLRKVWSLSVIHSRNIMSSHRHLGSLENGKIEFQPLTTETLQGALDVMRKNFFVNESSCVGVDLISEPGAPEEILDICKEVARDGLSIVAIDKSIEKVIGVFFSKIQVNTPGKTFFEQYREKCKYDASRAFLDFNINVDGRINLFKYFNVDCIFEFFCISVMPEYGHKGVGEMLASNALQISKDLKKGKDVRVPVTVHGNNELTNVNVVPSICSTILTSKYSQRLGDKFGFLELLRISFEEFEFKGKKFRDRITSKHIDCILAVKEIES
ncbi:uncharacterized protein LOC116842316 [Odontomachus brunneus]|uniref:uncharacterized protein LOC116842316 n=1 Tax=Odontomachus brunneus TaxID=486640 RepID=UPI0013F182D6|nr:uncharacterized protein LOC116842316 [Odontomachus brunneus]